MEPKRLIREPLVHFLVFGALLFLANGWVGNSAPVSGGQGGTPAAQVVVSRDVVDQMMALFEKTWQRPPTESERKALIEDFIRSEIYYREAIAIGLDRDDEVIKRRLRQRLEFIYEDISTWGEPSDADLAVFMKRNREKYLVDPELSFRQVFVSASQRGKGADPEARQVLQQLAAGGDPDTVGDPTMLAAEGRRMPLREITLQFGEEFGKALLSLKPGTWSGPLRSAYGLHLVLVKERQGGRLPELRDVREAVKRDWLVEKQKDLKDGAYAKIRERYTVVMEKPKSGSEPLAAAATTRMKSP